MALARLTVHRRSPYGEGLPPGAGPYEFIDATAHYRLDPQATANRTIVDLACAPVDGDGYVTFSGRVQLLVPTDGGTGRAVVDVVNRGRPMLPSAIHRAIVDPSAPPPVPNPGDGLLLEQGWTIAFVGWQHDIAHDSLIGLTAPPALDTNGEPRRGTVSYTFQPPTTTPIARLAGPGHRAYQVADPATTAGSTLLEDDLRVDQTRWRFSDGRTVELDGGFAANRRYTITYPTVGTPVTGTGLTALRDVAAFLREDRPDNPGRPVQHAFAFGVSQSGRVLRQVLADALNSDEAGRTVFDGMLIHIAGSSLGPFNQPFGHPGQLPNGTEPRFSTPELLDRAPGHAPKVIAINTSTEYWRGDGALLHTDPQTRTDLAGDDRVRIVHVTGAQHSSGTVPQVYVDPYLGTRGRLGFNTIDYRPVVRAALVHLAAWVCDGSEPPRSVHPRWSDGSLRPRSEVTAALRALDLPIPDERTAPDGALPAVDADGNEVGGLRLADVAVPLGIHAGWNVAPLEDGVGNRSVPLRGFTRWFEPTEILQRHGDRERFLDAVSQRAAQLVEVGWVLDRDRASVLESAADRWDDAMAEYVEHDNGCAAQ